MVLRPLPQGQPPDYSPPWNLTPLDLTPNVLGKPPVPKIIKLNFGMGEMSGGDVQGGLVWWVDGQRYLGGVLKTDQTTMILFWSFHIPNIQACLTVSCVNHV